MPEPSLLEIAAAVRSGATTAVAVTRAALDRITDRDPAIGAFVAVDPDRALRQAAEVDARIAAGAQTGPLAGVPIGVKDTEDTAGYRTTYGSLLWRDAPPADSDSILVGRLRAAGAVVVGKTNTPEIATAAHTDNLLFGPTRNPRALDRTPGGSSGGSAAAVASGQVPLATASDGGGSIRIPASVCGLPGFKPSLGRIPDGGPIPVDWPALTTRGVLTRTVAELVAVLDVVVGPDPTDLRSLPAPAVPWPTAVAEAGLPRRVAWSPTLGYPDVDADVLAACRGAVDRLARAGVEVVEVTSVFDREPYPVWSVLVSAYARRTIGDRDRTLLTEEVRDGLAAADRLTAADLVAAEDACHLLNLQLAGVFADCDLLLTPTLHTDPPRIGEVRPWVRALGVFNLTRSPAGTVPVGTSAAGVPIGLQVIGPQHGDVAVLAAMQRLEALSAQ